MVALRTLSQIRICLFFFIIGLMFYRFFHLIRHAFFKSCLFLQIGLILFFNFRQQDKRSIELINNYKLINLIITIFCLIGLFFNSGIIRKDFFIEILSILNSNIFFFIIFFLLFIITLIYCFYLIKIFLNKIRISLKIKRKFLFNRIILSVIIIIIIKLVSINFLIIKVNFIKIEMIIILLFFFLINFAFYSVKLILLIIKKFGFLRLFSFTNKIIIDINYFDFILIKYLEFNSIIIINIKFYYKFLIFNFFIVIFILFIIL
jgi:NADH:ubiquinone oxidoreductase subunit 5 (subunit L)/multisubunit Na+/H+ antiporter MnhA subunit